jgi:hypothetical protein
MVREKARTLWRQSETSVFPETKTGFLIGKDMKEHKLKLLPQPLDVSGQIDEV